MAEDTEDLKDRDYYSLLEALNNAITFINKAKAKITFDWKTRPLNALQVAQFCNMACYLMHQVGTASLTGVDIDACAEEKINPPDIPTSGTSNLLGEETRQEVPRTSNEDCGCRCNRRRSSDTNDDKERDDEQNSSENQNILPFNEDGQTPFNGC